MTKDDSRIEKDPICGKEVDTLRARAVGIFGGVTYYFCSAECKGKFKDPRQAKVTPSIERRKPEPVRDEPLEREERKPDLSKASREGDEPVRYARSRIRRITGEVGTPVVQIDLTPNKRPEATGERDAIEAAEPSGTTSAGRLWLVIAFVLLAAGGVAWFVFKK